MGISSSNNINGSRLNGKNAKSIQGQAKLESIIREFAECMRLQAATEERIDGITLLAITNNLCHGDWNLGLCLFRQFARVANALVQDTTLPDALTVDQFVRASDHYIGLITDAERLAFFIKGFSECGLQIQRAQVQELVTSAYRMAHLHHPEFSPQVAQAAIDAAMHNKTSIGVCYLNKWCLQNCHRLVYWMHRHIAHSLSSSLRHTRALSDYSTVGAAAAAAASQLERVSDNIDGKKDEGGDQAGTPKSSSVPGTPGSPVKATGIPRRASVAFMLEQYKSTTNAATALSRSLSQESDEEDEADGDTPVLDNVATLKSSLNPSLMWLLTCSLPLLYSKQLQSEESRRASVPVMTAVHNMLQDGQPKHWEPLYSSDRDGLSMNRFEHHVFNYRGPTLTILTSQEEDVAFCLALDQEWKDSKNFWGDDDCRLLMIKPQYKIVTRGANMMYFNQNWRGFPTGIQVGDNYESRALTVNKDLSLLQHYNIPYKLGSIEVWGCGHSQIRENQKEYKKRLNKDVEVRRKVKITSSDWMDHPDRYLIQMAGGRTSYATHESFKQIE